MGGTETILVVEDEAPLLKLMHHVLESYGYKVLESPTAVGPGNLGETQDEDRLPVD